MYHHNEPECQQMNLLRLSAVGQKWTRKKALAAFFSILHCPARQVLTERVFSCESGLRGSSHSQRWCSHCSRYVAMAKQSNHKEEKLQDNSKAVLPAKRCHREKKTLTMEDIVWTKYMNHNPTLDRLIWLYPQKQIMVPVHHSIPWTDKPPSITIRNQAQELMRNQ